MCAGSSIQTTRQGRTDNIVKFSEDNPADGYFIQKYDSERIIINDRGFDASLIISPERVIEHWQPQSIELLTANHFDAILELEPEIALLGTGEKLVFPNIETYSSLIQQGIGVEIMDTGAACRTYNILMGENRRVVAGLIL